MTPDVQEQTLFNIMNTPISNYPFPHCANEAVFPETYYDEILKNLPPLEAYKNIKDTDMIKGYKDDVERYILNLATDASNIEGDCGAFWHGLTQFMLGPRFTNMVLKKFQPFILQRFGNDAVKKRWVFTLSLLRDFKGYEIGPHTDSPGRVLNVFFYLPKKNDKPHLGTSFYAPKDPSFTCDKGTHHPFEDFVNFYTAPYKRNTMAAFFRTPRAFHGVDPIDEKVERNALALAAGAFDG